MGLELPTFRMELPNIRTDNPLHTAWDTLAAPINWIGSSTLSNPQVDQLGALGDRTQGQVEDMARVQQFRDAMSDRSVDNVTKDEINALYNAGGTSVQIGELLGAAREGNGIFAVRKINYARQIIENDMPGRQQLAAIQPKAGVNSGSNTDR